MEKKRLLCLGCKYVFLQKKVDKVDKVDKLDKVDKVDKVEGQGGKNF